jgi:hypothetical protein
MPEFTEDFDPGDLENLANTIQQSYCNRKSVQDGRRIPLVTRFKNPGIWLKAAGICADLKGDPQGFVEAAFQYNKVPGGPFPQQLCGQAIRRWYANYAKAAGIREDGTTQDILEAEVARDINATLRWCLSTGDFMGTMRNTHFWHLPAYVRCVLCPKDTVVINTFGREATGQIQANPKLMQILTDQNYSLAFMEKFK